MKAIIYTRFGSPEVLQFKEIAKPAPTPHEVLIRVHATSVSFGDLMARNFKAISVDVLKTVGNSIFRSTLHND